MEQFINRIFNSIELLIPEFMNNHENSIISNGNVAACIIDEQGIVYGKMYGTEKAKLRYSYKIAWTKASQVWLTGVKTGEYERMVFNNEVEENANGIDAPDLIGWEGGQPITLFNGIKISVGFSGFTGKSDINIIELAIQQLENNQRVK
jgi:glc operon protein GlcG